MPNDASAKTYPYSFLVVEDEAFMRDMLVRQLDQLGANGIATAANGREALAHLDEVPRQPDVLLLDLYMPDMDGIDVLLGLARRGYPGAVILVSGAEQAIMDIADVLGRHNKIAVLGTLRKPVQSAALARMLDKVKSP